MSTEQDACDWARRPEFHLYYLALELTWCETEEVCSDRWDRIIYIMSAVEIICRPGLISQDILWSVFAERECIHGLISLMFVVWNRFDFAPY